MIGQAWFSKIQTTVIALLPLIFSTGAEPATGAHDTVENQNKLLYDALSAVYNPIKSDIPVKIHNLPVFLRYSDTDQLNNAHFCIADINGVVHFCTGTAIYSITTTVNLIQSFSGRYFGTAMYLEQTSVGWNVYTKSSNIYYRFPIVNGIVGTQEVVTIPFWRPGVSISEVIYRKEMYTETPGFEYTEQQFTTQEVMGDHLFLNSQYNVQAIGTGFVISLGNQAYETDLEGNILALHSFSQPGFELAIYSPSGGTSEPYAIQNIAQEIKRTSVGLNAKNILIKSGNYWYLFSPRVVGRYE